KTGKWLGGNRPDITFQFGNNEDDRYRINTTSMRKDGNMTGREQASFNKLLDNIGSDLATAIPKFRPGMDEQEYADMVRQKCREVVGAKWSDHLEKGGKIPQSSNGAKGRE
ncbi:MAG: hypothetical protein K2X44_04360, partial [Magnetospirillum sp.]|nr:hypothetical protein [Magnetospirillum sp.]